MRPYWRLPFHFISVQAQIRADGIGVSMHYSEEAMFRNSHGIFWGLVCWGSRTHAITGFISLPVAKGGWWLHGQLYFSCCDYCLLPRLLFTKLQINQNWIPLPNPPVQNGLATPHPMHSTSMSPSNSVWYQFNLLMGIKIAWLGQLNELKWCSVLRIVVLAAHLHFS